MTGAKRRASARNGAGANGDVLQDADRQEPEEVRHASLSEERAEPGRVFEMELWEIAPSPLNEKLYRPIDDPDDPEIIALKESIAEHGVKEPLIITTDDVILSGHRRYVAAKLAGRESVPCIRVAIDSTTRNFFDCLASVIGSESKLTTKYSAKQWSRKLTRTKNTKV
jgi:ParB/Sulfiredoxin domain